MSHLWPTWKFNNQRSLFTYLGSHEGEDVDASVDVTDKDGEEKEEGAARLNGRQQHQHLDVE